MEVLETRQLLTAIPVPNFSFENPALASGGYTTNSVPNWTVSNGVGVENNTSAQFSSVPDGVQFAYANSGSFNGNNPGTLTSASLGAVADSQTYTLTVAVGNRGDTPYASGGTYTISLLDSGTALASQTLAGSSITPGTWQDLTLTYTTLATAATGSLQVQLSFSSSDQGDFDNVRLDGPAPTAPNAPSGLTATANPGGSISLSWTDNSPSNETGFIVDQATSSDFSTGLSSVTVGTGTTSYNVGGLSPTTTYYYRVRATNAVGDSGESNTANATTVNFSMISVPNGSFEANSTGPIGYSNPSGGYTDTTDVADWTVADSGAGAYPGFQVFAGTDGTDVPFDGSNFIGLYPGGGTTPAAGEISTTAEADVTSNPFSVSLTQGTEYTATAEIGQEDLSNAAQYGGAPTFKISLLDNGNVVATGTGKANYGVAGAGNWTAVSTLGFTPSSSSTDNLTIKIAMTGFYSADGAYVATNPIIDDVTLTSVAGTAPAAPTGLTATAAPSTNQINLSWTNNANNQSGFEIDQSTDNTFATGVTTTTVGPSVTSYNATGLSISTTYYYRVRAINGVGDSAYSNTANATTSAITSIPVPDGDFSSDTPGYNINTSIMTPGYNQSGETFPSPLTASLSGWSIVADPSTTNGGAYAPGAWIPFGAVDNVTSGGSTPDNDNGPYISNQPGSVYHDFVYYPGEQFATSGGELQGPTGAQAGASLTMTTTGISYNSVADTLYTATIEYANVSYASVIQNGIQNHSATVELNILANGVVVGTGTLSGLNQNSPWTTVTANWTAGSADAGQALQLQVVANNFLEGPYQWQVPTFAFANTTLTTAPGTVPVAPSGLTATTSVLAPSSQINLSWTDTADNETGFQIDQSTSSDFTQNLTTASVGANVYTYSETSLAASTTYYYRVRAINDMGPSANTATASATTSAPSISIPDGNFSSDADGFYINSATGPATFTMPITATLSGWGVTAVPSTANGGNYSGFEPFGALESVTSGTGGTPNTYNNDLATIGNAPASPYQAFVYYPGELYNSGGTLVAGPQPGASLTLTTTGISATAVTGTTYTATILYANVSSSAVTNPGANVTLNILANGIIVGTSTLTGLAQGSPWTPVTATWTAASAYAGQAIQLEVVANNFLENGGPYQVPTIAFAGATLTAATGVSNLPAWITPTSTAAWNAASDTLIFTGPSTITANPGADEPIIITTNGGSAAVLTINTGSTTPVNIGSVNVTDNGSVKVSDSGGPQVLVVASGANNFSIDSTSTFDLGKNYLDLQNSGGNIAGIDALLQSGFGNGTWNGTGLTSSDANADASYLTALGSIVNDGQFNSNNTFDGVIPGSNDILIHRTYYGDANLSGNVDGTDYSLIDAGFGSSGSLKGWQNGDFNYDGSIDGSDYSLIDNAFNQQGATPLAEVAASAVQVAPSATTNGKSSKAVGSSLPVSTPVFAGTGTIGGSSQTVDNDLDSWQPKRTSKAVFLG
jgi:Fibronectin type III domain